MKKTILLLTTFLIGINFSCQEQEEIVNEPIEQASAYPSVLSAVPSSESSKNTLRTFLLNGRIENNLAIEAATTVIYEDMEELAFAYVPHADNSNTFTVFAEKNGELAAVPFTFINNGNSLQLVSETRTVTYIFEGSQLVDLQLSENGSNGRTEDCFTSGFIDCANGIQDELRAAVGDTATFFIDIGCGLAPWCRASYAIACSVGGVANCGLFN